MSRVRAASYNAAYHLDARQGAVDDYYTLFEEADLVGLQEVGRSIDKQQINSVALEKGFGIFFSDKQRSCPVAWNKAKFELLDKGAKFLSPRTFVGAKGAGPSTLKAKYLVWVKLRHKESGRIFYFANCHLAPSIYISARRRLHIRQTDGIRDWIKSRRNLVLVVGDFNIDAQRDAKDRDPRMPYVKFGRINVISNWKALGYTKVGTHGNSHIDYVWFRTRRAIRAISQRVITGLSSDHRPPVVEFDVSLTLRRRVMRQVSRVRLWVKG